MRPINEIILHCTATPEGRPVTVREIDQWHRARGWSGIGYHYVVHLDGRVDVGRSVGMVGAHVAGHNTGTIGVVYVGGVEKDGRTAKDTRTPAQKASIEELLIDLQRKYGARKLSGHNEYAAKACPSFSVQKEYARLITTHFGLSGAPSSSRDGILERGDSGPEVAAWIDRLIDAGYDVPKGRDFDQLVDQVTRWFQAKRGIVIDGKVGPQTQDEMDRFLKGLAPFQPLPNAVDRPKLAGEDTFVVKAPWIMDDLMADLGIGILDAAAILGNIGHECAGFEHLEQINGSAYGWPQWDGERREAYFAWCLEKGLHRASDAANYGFLIHELRTTEKRSIAALKSATGLDAKTIAFEKAFERAGVKHYASRQAYAALALEAYEADSEGPAEPIRPADGLTDEVDVERPSATAGGGTFRIKAGAYLIAAAVLVVIVLRVTGAI